jgi:hypothetical protein
LLLLILITECENGEARKPMLAHVAIWGRPTDQMIFGPQDKGAPIVAARQGVTERAPAPGPAEIESVEMSDLATCDRT